MKKINNLTKLNVENENISDINESEYLRGEHPNSLKNLKPFKEGESGNPSGRAKAFAKLKDDLKALADVNVYDDTWNSTVLGTRRELVLKGIWDKAQDGKLEFIMILERLGCLD